MSPTEIFIVVAVLAIAAIVLFSYRHREQLEQDVKDDIAAAETEGKELLNKAETAAKNEVQNIAGKIESKL